MKIRGALKATAGLLTIVAAIYFVRYYLKMLEDTPTLQWVYSKGQPINSEKYPNCVVSGVNTVSDAKVATSYYNGAVVLTIAPIGGIKLPSLQGEAQLQSDGILSVSVNPIDSYNSESRVEASMLGDELVAALSKSCR